ncbi:acyltransferase family protein [Dryocola sp. BD586]|uniref:acyltransferase family protein n=1 Tax=Dryocola sp. BD586 TaxID=3133271 RepID=UPI003F50B2E1
MKEFRKDIQGLRALAVMSVVLYHFNNGYLSGGFAGVDVFFVISGFLMTSIIIKGAMANNFSILKFYISRAKRIAPSLCIVVLALLIFGYLFIEPLTYKEIGGHSYSSLLFYSNYIYFGESGYFDQSSKEKFLLHTWSLSVEWQFYILYPIMILAAYRYLPVRFFRLSIASLFIISFIFSAIITKSNPDYSYFMITTRAWEMLLGGLVCLYPLSLGAKPRKAIEVIGIILVIASFFIFNDITMWPGLAATIPTFGAALIISSNTKKSLLSNGALQFIGKISYSLYLVHWVVLVAFKKMYIPESFPIYFLSIFAISISLYYFVERRRNFGYASLAIYVLTVYISHIVSLNGINSRLDDAKEFMVDAKTYRAQNEGHDGLANSPKPLYFNSDEKNFEYILIGSSHARHFYHYISTAGKKVVSLALDGCDSTSNYFSRSSTDSCLKRYQLTIDFINAHPGKKIIWATVWNEPKNKRDASFDDSEININAKWNLEISSFIKDIVNSKSTLYLIGDTPGSKKLMFECLAKNSLPINRLLNSANCDTSEPKENKAINPTLESIAKKYSKVYFIDPREALCYGNSCNVIINGKPVYTDYGHLSKTGSTLVGEYIFSKMH